MATLTIKNFPDELYRTLSQTAKRHRRSINSEAIFRLEESLSERQRDTEEILERIRSLRKRLADKGVWLTDEMIDLAKNEGRP